MNRPIIDSTQDDLLEAKTQANLESLLRVQKELSRIRGQHPFKFRTIRKLRKERDMWMRKLIAKR